MSDLQRQRAPFSNKAWAEVDGEAKRVLKLMLAGRKLCDFVGPLGWSVSAVDTGRTQKVDGATEGVQANLRRSQPLLELRVPFVLSRDELEAVERGAKDADLEPVVKAAQAMAKAEDTAIFDGYPEAQITGICSLAQERTVSISEDYQSYPSAVVSAIERLKQDGVDGPYAIGLGPKCYAGLTSTRSAGGYPILSHVKKLLDGPIVWAPALDGAVVMSMRGGDFELTVGRDISIGYYDHDAKEVQLYLQESMTFRAFAAEAAVPLRYK